VGPLVAVAAGPTCVAAVVGASSTVVAVVVVVGGTVVVGPCRCLVVGASF